MIFLSKHATYIPKCRGNRELSAEDQVRFDIHAMTGDEEERLVLMAYKTVEDGKESVVIDYKIKETFLSQVDRVYGVYKDEARREEVTTANEFMKLPDTYEYITETVAYIKRGLEEKEIKN
jgi:hypothetical protein